MMLRRCIWLAAAAAAGLGLWVSNGYGFAHEWPAWRGPERNAIADESQLLERWPESGPPLLWKTDGLGGGYSSVVIAQGRIYTMGLRGNAAHVICLELDGGQEIWSARVGPGEPNCTPTFDDGRVYGLGAEGDLVCVDAQTGRETWRKNFKQDFGGQLMSGWGYSESPLVDGDRLICTPGGKQALLAALDKRTGQTIWTTPASGLGRLGVDGAAYASPVMSEACGVRQYVQVTGRGVVSAAADDGRLLWSYNRIANDTANIPTPLVDGDHVFCSTGYGTGAALLQVVRQGRQLDVREVYFLPAQTMQNHHGGMVLLDGYIYCGHGHNQGFPLCVELKTGKVAWHGGRGPGKGSAAVLCADGQLYFRYEDGVMALIEARPDRYVLNGEFRIASNNGKSWPHPVIVDGLLYLRDQGTMLCYDLRAK
jgi:outer membrane protein assembly factor BamB